jgi:hypothetical protein
MRERFIPSLRRKVYERSLGRCEGCHRRISPQQMNAHHLRPFSAGGATSLSNLACLCKSCHILVHEQWPIRRGVWRNLPPGKMPREHREYLKRIFSWEKFPPAGESSGNATLRDFRGVGGFTEYHWQRERWRYRIWRNRRPRSTKEGRTMMQRIVRKWLSNSR